MKWLTLSPDKFQTLPDISFSIQKPLLAASAIVTYKRAENGAIESSASLRVKIPLKALVHYSLKAVSLSSDTELRDADFAFSEIEERNETAGKTKIIKASDLTIANESPVAILAHALVLPAFQETRDANTTIYAAHILMGTKVQALRFERLSVREGEEQRIETFEGKFITVSNALDEAEWSALAWDAKKGFEFDWNVEGRSIEAARVRVPIFGQLEVRA